MRLRKVKNAKERLMDGNYFIEDPISFKGKWKEVFGNDNPIHIEIGCGRVNSYQPFLKTTQI